MSENDLELGESKTSQRNSADLKEPLLEQKNLEVPVIQPPIESCESKFERTLVNSCLSYTYLRTIPFIKMPMDMIRYTLADHAPPAGPTSIAVQHAKLYAVLGFFSKLCRLGAVTLPLLSSATELLRIVQENKSTFNEGYADGLQQDSEKYSSMADNFFIISSATFQGITPSIACPTAFIGAQKIANAKNVKEVLIGIAFLGVGVTTIIGNSACNYTSQLVRDQGEYYGYLCGNFQGCLGEEEQYLPTYPTGINSFVSSISAAACGFMYGLIERARTYMRETGIPDPASDNKPINN